MRLLHESQPGLEHKVEELTRELSGALDREAAISEVLRAASGGQANVQPVLDRMTERAAVLCDAACASVWFVEGDELRRMSVHGRKVSTGAEEDGVVPISRGRPHGRAVLDRRAVHVEDVAPLLDTEYPEVRDEQRRFGMRTLLIVPALSQGTALGIIVLWRLEARMFSEEQVALLQTFADHLVVTIENLRLSRHLEARNARLTEALEQQTATSEILKAISDSPTDVQPVFETMVQRAVRLCDALFCVVYTYDGKLIQPAAHHNMTPTALESLKRMWPAPPSRDTVTARSILERTVVHVADVNEEGVSGSSMAFGQTLGGYRAMLAVPMFREGVPIGTITLARRERKPFSDQQIALLKTFADQAVIAIENVRLFQELQARTRELARSVEELKALGEVGRAVSSTLDLKTVLTTIVARALELAGADGGAISEYDEATRHFQLRATYGVEPELVELVRAAPIRLGEGITGKAAATRAAIQVADILDEREYGVARVRNLMARLGYRSALAVPLLREDRIVGSLSLWRRQVGHFPPNVVNMLQTFASHSTLAIENARLFNEIREKSTQLEIASQHKSAFVANMSHELRTPLNAVIGFTRIVMRRSQERLEPKQYQNLEKILSSAQHLLSLINAILDLAKVEAGRIDLHPSEVRVAPVLEQCMRTVEPLVKDETVVLVKGFDHALPEMYVDEQKLRQIVINLLSNAVKFTARGMIHLRATAANGSVEITVTDTGIGIAADKLDLIFEEFEQVDASSTRVHGGTGLGLAIARRLARLMGGDIRVESTLGEGSTFTLTLPVRFACS